MILWRGATSPLVGQATTFGAPTISGTRQQRNLASLRT